MANKNVEWDNRKATGPTSQSWYASFMGQEEKHLMPDLKS